jgi:hypothetical protein
VGVVGWIKRQPAQNKISLGSNAKEITVQWWNKFEHHTNTTSALEVAGGDSLVENPPRLKNLPCFPVEGKAKRGSIQVRKSVYLRQFDVHLRQFDGHLRRSG